MGHLRGSHNCRQHSADAIRVEKYWFFITSLNNSWSCVWSDSSLVFLQQCSRHLFVLFRTHSSPMNQWEWWIKRGHTGVILSKALSNLWFKDVTRALAGLCSKVLLPPGYPSTSSGTYLGPWATGGLFKWVWPPCRGQQHKCNPSFRHAESTPNSIANMHQIMC